MIDTAWVSCSSVTGCPVSSLGARMICVPPSRSSASLGVQDPPPHSTAAVLITTRATTIAPSHEGERHAFLTGVDFATEGTQLSTRALAPPSARVRRGGRVSVVRLLGVLPVDVDVSDDRAVAVGRLVDALT